MAKAMTAAEMARRRWEKVSAAEHSAITTRAGRKGGRAAWAGMTAAERSAEMKRRAAKRKRRARQRV